MAAITSEQVRDLRAQTGAGIMDCKSALNEAAGDIAKAVELLRKKGLAGLAKRAGRAMKEGVVVAKASADGKVVSFLELNCETDFVARTDEFQKLVRSLAMQVAGLAPEFVTIDSIPADVLAAKRQELLSDPMVQGKPEAIRAQIVDGQLRKWQQQVVLYEQPYRDTDQTVGELVTAAVARIGEHIRVRRFTRYELGEEL